MDIVNYIIDFSTDFISTGGLLYGFIIVFMEALLPMLPLGVFVALNVTAFGFFIGTLLSYIATMVGSFLVYLLFTVLEEKFISKFLNKKKLGRLRRGLYRFRNITLSQLVLIITLPFTPSFLVNILSGMAKISKEKFILALIIGKIFVVIFWGYIGKSIITGYDDLKSIIFIAVALLIAYIISKIVSKKMDIE